MIATLIYTEACINTTKSGKEITTIRTHNLKNLKNIRIKIKRIAPHFKKKMKKSKTI